MMECAKIAGFEVSPATPSSRMRRARLPSSSMPRLIPSNQTLTPSFRSSSSGFVRGALMRCTPVPESSAGGRASLAVLVRICVNHGPRYRGRSSTAKGYGHDRQEWWWTDRRGVACAGERCRDTVALDRERGRRRHAGSCSGDAAGLACAPRRSRGSGARARPRRRHLRSRQPVAGGRHSRRCRAAARPHHGPQQMMDASAPLPEASEPTAEPGTVRGLFAALLDALHTRLELAQVELEIHLRALLRSLIWAVGAVACAMLGVTCGVMALIVALWNTHRMLGLLGGMVAFVGLAALFGYQGMRALRVRPGALEGSLAQLAEDERRARGGP